MRFIANKYSTIALLVVTISFYSCKTNSSQEEESTIETQSLQEVGIGDIILEDLEAKDIDLQEYQGKVIVLNFWATWCKPCISEMPSIDRLIAELGEEEYVFLAASDENMDKIKKFAEKSPHEFQYVRLKTNVYKLGLNVLPTTFIINRKGEVIDKIIGAKEWDSDESIELLRNI